VVTVGALHAGEAFNTISDKATLVGTVRCFSEDVRQKLERMIRQIAESEASAYGARVAIDHETLFAATVNTAEHARFVEEAAREVVAGDAIVRNPPPELGSEDFSFMLQRRPGCYFLIGQGDAEHQAACHDVNYDFNDGILPMGAAIFTRLVERRLAPKPG
jgi:hippurate hydrolase